MFLLWLTIIAIFHFKKKSTNASSQLPLQSSDQFKEFIIISRRDANKNNIEIESDDLDEIEGKQQSTKKSSKNGKSYNFFISYHTMTR